MSQPLTPTCSTNETIEFDATRHEAFGERVVNMLNEASLTFMCSIGHRTGLLDTLHRLNRPAKTHEIAEESGLNERYIREWLGAMVTGRIIEYDADTH